MSTAQMPNRQIRYMDTTAAYDLWAEHYDGDGNFLQAMDTIEMRRLLPKLLNKLDTTSSRKMVDLGCGTGRNTLALLHIPNIDVVALDASPKMLEIARKTLDALPNRPPTTTLQLQVFNILVDPAPPSISINADAVISTLVIEHTPVDAFLKHVSQMLKPGGVLLLTNMHSDMGKISQAGFNDPVSGEKIRPVSYAHTTQEVLISASKHGLEIIDELESRTVTEDMVERLGRRSAKWIGINVWFGGLFRKVS